MADDYDDEPYEDEESYEDDEPQLETWEVLGFDNQEQWEDNMDLSDI